MSCHKPLTVLQETGRERGKEKANSQFNHGNCIVILHAAVILSNISFVDIYGQLDGAGVMHEAWSEAVKIGYKCISVQIHKGQLFQTGDLAELIDDTTFGRTKVNTLQMTKRA